MPKNALRAEKERYINSLKTQLEDGVLFYVQYDDKEKQSVKSKRQWISDEKKQKQVLQYLHDDSAGGCHFGRDKTRDKVSRRYFWHGQFDDIDEYIKTCDKCKKVCIPHTMRIVIIVTFHHFHADKSQVPEVSIRVEAYPNYHHMGSNRHRSDRTLNLHYIVNYGVIMCHRQHGMIVMTICLLT